MTEAPKPRFRENPTAFVLRLFGDVRAGEAGTALLLTLDVFLILVAYYLLKVAREPLILLGGGAEVKSYASVGQTVLLVIVSGGYGWLAARMGRIALITSVTLFFIANLLVFFVLGASGAKIGVPFYLWVGIFNIVTIAQFWSFAADTYTDEQGKRLFPIVGIGSSVGAVGGAWLASPIVARGTPYTLMGVAAAVLLVSLGILILVSRREPHERRATKKVDEPVAPGNAFALVMRDRYLLVFAVLVLALNFVTKTGDYVLDRMLLHEAPAHAHALGVTQTEYIAQFKAHYFALINTIGVLVQLFMVSRIVKYAGLRAALVMIPLASVAGYGTAFVFPILGALMVGRVVESSLDYSLSNTAQQTLWLPTSREAKYKGKQVIDSVCRRAGDMISAGVVWLGMRYALSTRTFLAVNVAITVVWILAAWKIGSMWQKSVPDAKAQAPVGVPRRKVRGRTELPSGALENAEEVPGE
ncbi:MAG TPA: Npt1/Npt2 family nucleotide transporter [Polyangiaceae bacterium]|jgi:AAA family ATP:ADP antiporter